MRQFAKIQPAENYHERIQEFKRKKVEKIDGQSECGRICEADSKCNQNVAGSAKQTAKWRTAMAVGEEWGRKGATDTKEDPGRPRGVVTRICTGRGPP